MNPRRNFTIACLCLLLVGMLPVLSAARSPAYFSYSLDSDSVMQGEAVRLNVTAYKTEDTAAGFRLKVSYDEDVLNYISTETSGAIKSGTMHTSCSSGLISCVYVCNPEKGYAPKLSGQVVSFVFEVGENAKQDSTALTVSADQICDYDGNPLDADNTEKKLNLKILSSPSSEAYLLNLKPSVGTLEPEFSASVHTYQLHVGSDVDKVTFEADAADFGTARANRTTLYRAGTETPITVTVTSEDKTQTSQYLIQVQREERMQSSSSAGASNSADHEEQALSEEPISSEHENSPQSNSSVSSQTHGESYADGQKQFTPEETVFSEQHSIAMNSESAQLDQDEDRTLILVGDRMPSFFTGMFAAVLCITVGIIISLWLPIRFRRQ